MEFSEVIAKRISIRKYKDTPVEPEKIAQLMEWLRIAPSAANRQEWKFVAPPSAGRWTQNQFLCQSYGKPRSPETLCIAQPAFKFSPRQG